MREVYSARFTAYGEDDEKTSCDVGIFESRDDAIDAVMEKAEYILSEKFADAEKKRAKDRFVTANNATVYTDRYIIGFYLKTYEYFPKKEEN